MADFRPTPKVSRHTMVMRRAKDEDARRVAEANDDDVLVHSADVGASCSLTARGAVPHTGQSARISARDSRVSGRASARILSGRQTPAAIGGGDTIIRYQSGTVVVKRGARRASFRKQALTVYAVGYLVIFGLFLYWLLGSVRTLAPEQYIATAFHGARGDSVALLREAALAAMRGSRTPAEIRLAQDLSFYDDARNTVTVEKGDRLTLITASMFAKALLDDMKKPADRREYAAPIEIYREGHLSDVNWPRLMTGYNAIGFFLIVFLFLWRPGMHYLGTEGRKTAAALANARQAGDVAAEYRDKYRALADAIEEQRTRRREETLRGLEEEREASLAKARRDAADIAGGVRGALHLETRKRGGDIGRDAIRAACASAAALLAENLGQREHDAAVDELIAVIARGAAAAAK